MRKKSQAWVSQDSVYQLRVNIEPRKAPMAKRVSILTQVARIFWPKKKASRATNFFNGIRRQA